MNTIHNRPTYLIDLIERNEYFQRSINISYDNNDSHAIENFYCPISYEQVIIKMIHHIQQSGQAAFTWTGPYGSGKSSLALFLQALINNDKDIVKIATSKLSNKHKSTIINYFNAKNGGWRVLNLIGQTQSPEQLFKDALDLPPQANSREILETLADNIKQGQRVLIFIDELGKVFDGAVKSSRPEDIYFLQQLAEFVNRSQGNILLIGVLHQSFMAYARQVSTKIHDEWLKIQGRFIDCVVMLSIDEQIHLIGQVIKIKDKRLITYQHSENSLTQIKAVVDNIAMNRKTDSEQLTQLLQAVFPLHPLVSILLCQLSKKNFGQNQRSLFSFLMSAEPNGFGYYLRNTSITDFSLFTPCQFWDYLDSNLNSTLQVSEYSKQWLLSQMAVQRYEELNNEMAVRLIKIISLISIFADGTGIHASPKLLQTLLGIPQSQLNDLLETLEVASIIFYRKFTQSYSLSEGSDFNLSEAIKSQLQELDSLPFEQLEQFEPIVAKAHYQNTGSLRWMEVKLLPVTEMTSNALLRLQNNSNESLVGYFCLLLPKNDSEISLALSICETVTKSSTSLPNLVVAILDSHNTIIDLLKDKIALTNILKNDKRLLNDKIARQETEGRLVEVEDTLNQLLDKSLGSSKWYSTYLDLDNDNTAAKLNRFQLSALASKIADKQVSEYFICNNELVNRNKPSPSAKGAIRELLKRMIENSEEENLAIEKYPPEKGIYESVLLKNGLHKADADGNCYFARPTEPKLVKIWECADNIIANNKGQLVTASQIYQAWQQPPYGIKSGLHEILYVAYILSRHSDLANYINGEYKPTVQYLLAEYLIKVPDQVGIREVSFLEETQTWVHVLKEQLESEFATRLKSAIQDEPLPIAQALVSIFDSMHPWIQRTNELSSKTKQLRNILKQANDPNQLLFDDLPRFFNANDDDDKKVEKIITGLFELDYKYPTLVEDINTKLIDYLKVKKEGINPFLEINQRAASLFGKSGDYLLDAFIARLVKYDGSMKDTESLISLLAGNKPAKKWIDQDIIKAKQQIAAYCFQFLEAEVNADIHTSPDRQKIGIITKSPNETKSQVREAHITDLNAKRVEEKATEILTALADQGFDLNDQIAIIAKFLNKLEGDDQLEVS
ncbi:hypothetical protein [Psychrobacter sp. I-STPA10]|uniref:hypothetical protein n=1 Tax=Psychrobacter sp. I-STPA10 TaxID=2585769 RepID=UPI001E467C16|nr:hypothetical protein [Psychrobacter sp. I-STPA10]